MESDDLDWGFGKLSDGSCEVSVLEAVFLIQQFNPAELFHFCELVAPPKFSHETVLDGKHGDSFVLHSEKHLLENVFLVEKQVNDVSSGQNLILVSVTILKAFDGFASSKHGGVKRLVNSFLVSFVEHPLAAVDSCYVFKA